MRELYWLSVLGSLSEIVTYLTFVVLLLLCATCTVYIITVLCSEENSRLRKILIKGSVCLVLLALLSSFLPSKKELYVIYGVGKTLDYLQSNEDAKELPDNVIKALNKLAEEYAKEDEKRHEKE